MLSAMHPATYRAFRDELIKISGYDAFMKMAGKPPVNLARRLIGKGPPRPAPPRPSGMSVPGQAFHASFPQRGAAGAAAGAGPKAGEVISGRSIARPSPIEGMSAGDNPLAGMILPDKARQMRGFHAQEAAQRMFGGQ